MLQSVPSRAVARVTPEAYDAAVAALRADYDAIPPHAPVRLAKRTSNLFRDRARTGVPGLDVSAFRGVLDVDVDSETADVLGMTTYEELVDATLAHGMIPKVVPQLRTITLGGAVTGLGIESTSFRSGLPHESVLEMDVLAGDGRVVTASAENEHSDLFHGFPNSYGTLGYALRLTIELEPVPSHVRLRHLPFRGPRALEELFDAVGAAVESGEVDGVRVDGLDATLFSPEEAYLTAATWEEGAPYVSDYTGMNVYYRSIRERDEDHLTVRDYLWRWDTDWFWCSKAFGAQNPAVRRLWPKSRLRSDTYWRLVALDGRTGFSRRLDRLRGRPAREKVIQDVEIPLGRAAEFARWLDAEIHMRPVWACPLRQRDDEAVWDLYPFEAATTYVNFGFWGTVALEPGETDGHHDRRIEAKVDALGGRKSLYSRAYYTPDDFWRLYGGAAYEVLKKTYDADGRLLDLYAKCVGGR